MRALQLATLATLAASPSCTCNRNRDFAEPSVASDASTAREIREQNWAALREAWEKYAQAPTDQNGRAVLGNLPNFDTPPSPLSIEDEVREKIYGDVHVLDDQVKKSKKIAVQITFRLLNMADGDFAESLEIILGKLIRANARLFLQELGNFGSKDFCPKGIIGNLGDDFVDQPKEAVTEITLRKAALTKVTDPKFASSKATCLRVIESVLREEQQDLKTISSRRTDN